MQHCLEVAGRSVDLHQRLGWSYVGHWANADGLEIDLRGPDVRTPT
jgi:hypothetical protein